MKDFKYIGTGIGLNFLASYATMLIAKNEVNHSLDANFQDETARNSAFLNLLTNTARVMFIDCTLPALLSDHIISTNSQKTLLDYINGSVISCKLMLITSCATTFSFAPIEAWLKVFDSSYKLSPLTQHNPVLETYMTVSTFNTLIQTWIFNYFSFGDATEHKLENSTNQEQELLQESSDQSSL